MNTIIDKNPEILAIVTAKRLAQQEKEQVRDLSDEAFRNLPVGGRA